MTSRKTWDDLTVREKAEVSDEEFELYLDVGRMEKGTYLPREPEYLEVPETPVPETETRYRISAENPDYSWGSPEFFGRALFVTQEAALDALALIDCGYKNNSALDILQKHPLADVKIVEVQVVSPEFAEAHGEVFEKAKAARKHNKLLREEYAAALSECSAATEDLREERNDAIATGARVAEVKQVFSDYISTAQNDAGVAWGFLQKAFTAERLKEVEDWDGEPLYVAPVAYGSPEEE